MTELAKGSPEEKVMLAHTVDLLTHYSFDLGTETANQHLDRWRAQYQVGWIRWAVIEALYQGRYKAVSVDQILQLWHRRQHPCYHFSYEFERLVCNRFPRNLVDVRSRTRVVERSQPKPAKTILPPRVSPSPSDPAVLPTLPSPNRVPAGANEPPAWAELAEQIHQDPPQILPSYPAKVEANPVVQPPISEERDAAIDPAEVLSERVARLQAGVDALIEQATSSLTASTEGVKTRLRHEEALPLEETPLPEPALSPAIAEEIHPPIHQFTPASDPSDFHSKLKAVVEQEVRE